MRKSGKNKEGKSKGGKEQMKWPEQILYYRQLLTVSVCSLSHRNRDPGSRFCKH
jgi:hypothetical protein